jgi:hypothetical protein
MRIVKLSTAEFPTLADVKRFFLADISLRTPPGKFRVPPGWIAEDKIEPNEPLVFTYETKVVFTARAGSGLLQNEDDQRARYPSYFVVNLTTLRTADRRLEDVEREYNSETSANIKMHGSQGWNRLPDTAFTLQLWARLGGAGSPRDALEEFHLPEEILAPSGLIEGSVRAITVNSYERSTEARRSCIEYHGDSCSVCGVNFGATYGPVAQGYIHVHHLRSLSEIAEEYVVDPVQDLRPICPNCHAVMHLRVPPYTIVEVKAFLAERIDRKA